MIVVRLMGGLGNQMFQYAFGKRMAILNKTELVLDQSLLLDKSQAHEIVTHRDFDLDIFNIKNYRWAKEKEVVAFNGNPSASVITKIIRRIKNSLWPKKLIIQSYNEMNEKYFHEKGDVCFVGRWQSELYFKDIENDIRNEFTFKAPLDVNITQFSEIITNCHSVCLHIRRGDLITSPIYNQTIGVLDWSYYETAIQKIREQVVNPVFFVFSDDIDWCKTHITLPEKTYYVDNSLSGDKASGHLYLMSQCQHFIISNSTYAWWGAWLSNNKNKVVLYPSKWYNDTKYNNSLMSPDSWIAL